MGGLLTRLLLQHRPRLGPSAICSSKTVTEAKPGDAETRQSRARKQYYLFWTSV